MEGQNYRTPLITDNTNIIDVINLNANCVPDYNYGNDNCHVKSDAEYMLAFDLTCLFFSGWFILTGILPFCMTEKRRNNWRCLKITFLVFCIIGACIFVPSVFSTAMMMVVFRANDSGALAALPSFLALFAIAELVVAIVAASYCCCCSTWETTNRSAFVIATPNYSGNVMTANTTPNQPHNVLPSGYSYGSTPEQQMNTQGSATQQPLYKA